MNFQVRIVDKWETVKKASIALKGWLHYELRDGTIGLAQPKNWRFALDSRVKKNL